MSEEWIVACDETSVAKNDVARFDHLDATYAVVRMSDGVCNVIDGLCTHGKAHLAEGFVDGTTIECPKHNGRFNYKTGAAQRAPVTVNLKTNSTRVLNGTVEIEVP